VVDDPFCKLVRFARSSDDAATRAKLASDPKVLLCAPLSGHHASLLRDTARSLIAEHDVYVTDWVDARNVPLSAGSFGLDDYVHTIQRHIRMLGAADLHVIAVCQPTVPVLGAVSLLAQAGEATPRTLTLMGGPIDARKSPTEVNKLATKNPLSWFEGNLIHKVPSGFPGAGRRVYPGFLQLTAFVSMNFGRHLESYWSYWFDVQKGDAGALAASQHERFYDDYNAVLDMDAPYYLDVVREVFQEFTLAKGTWTVGGVRVRPDAIKTTALYTIEGELDDICGVGQTQAAHALCTGIPERMKRHTLAKGVGHYGIFSGRKWREQVYPHVRAFVAEHAATPHDLALRQGAVRGEA
jgi:poly(3-hydroxybutyrate) depolymerase